MKYVGFNCACEADVKVPERKKEKVKKLVLSVVEVKK
jgi:hypothetical protein